MQGSFSVQSADLHIIWCVKRNKKKLREPPTQTHATARTTPLPEQQQVLCPLNSVLPFFLLGSGVGCPKK